MRNNASTAALGLIAMAAIIAGAIVSASGADPAALWAIAATASGAVGGAMLPAQVAQR